MAGWHKFSETYLRTCSECDAEGFAAVGALRDHHPPRNRANARSAATYWREPCRTNGIRVGERGDAIVIVRTAASVYRCGSGVHTDRAVVSPKVTDES